MNALASTVPHSLDALFPSGADSYSDPRLPGGYVVRSWNCVLRGGVLRTRPGTRHLYTIAGAALAQGFAVYAPRRGHPQHVAVVDGYVYVADYPFSEYRQLPGVRLSATAPQVYFAQAVQAIERNADGSLTFLDYPRNTLVVQDGVTAPVIYDGHVATHDTNVDGCPLGTAMAWSGNRLWVARDNRIFASDIYNPRSFVEQFYLGGSDSLLLPERVTALVDIQNAGLSSAAMLIFGPNSTTSVATGLVRESWPTTPGFMATFLPSVGCAAERSPVYQNGRLWWYSQRGLTALDVAQRAMVTAAFPTVDNEMAFSKAYVDETSDGVCTTAFDNMLAVSVPYGNTGNTHTWIYDTALTNVGGSSAAGWVSVWTGFRPVQFGRYVDGASERIFALVQAASGNISVIEVGVGLRDSGSDIEARVELRAHTGSTPVQKQLGPCRITFSDLHGDADVAVLWRGLSRGAYKRSGEFSFRVPRGVLESGKPVPKILFGSHPQFRRVRTQDPTALPDDAHTSAGKQTIQREAIDSAFSFCLVWSGQLALREFTPEFILGKGEIIDPHPGIESVGYYTRFDGATDSDPGALADVVQPFSATVSATGSARGDTESATRTARTWANQRAADRMARQAADAQVDELLVRNAPGLIGLG